MRALATWIPALGTLSALGGLSTLAWEAAKKKKGPCKARKRRVLRTALLVAGAFLLGKRCGRKSRRGGGCCCCCNGGSKRDADCSKD